MRGQAKKIEAIIVLFLDNFDSKSHFDAEVKEYEQAHKKAQKLLDSLTSLMDDNGDLFYSASANALKKEIKDLESFYEKLKNEAMTYKFRE